LGIVSLMTGGFFTPRFQRGGHLKRGGGKTFAKAVTKKKDFTKNSPLGIGERAWFSRGGTVSEKKNQGSAKAQPIFP